MNEERPRSLVNLRSILDARRDSCPTCQNVQEEARIKRSDSVQTDILVNTINYAKKRARADQWMLRERIQRSDSLSHRYCFPCLAKYRKPVIGAPIQLKLRYMFSCPPHGKVALWMTLGLQAVLLWGTLWAILGHDVLPGGNIFNIVVLIIVCTFLGLLVESVGLPRLLGVLLGGILLRNVPGIDIATGINREWSFALRKIAVVVVLIRAGIGSDPRALVQRKWTILRLTLFPVVIEGATVAVATHFLLGFPWIWSFLQGFVLAPMSAAAAIPFMLQFQQAGYGVTKGIPTTIKFGACFDNVLGICIFSVLLDVAFDKNQDNLVYTILMKGPVQLVLGVAVGVTCGLTLWYLPHRNSVLSDVVFKTATFFLLASMLEPMHISSSCSGPKKRKVFYRTSFLFGLCLFGAFATGTASFSSAGPLGVICTALVARLKWRFQGWTGVSDPLPPIFAYIWKMCQILLAGLIGALLDIRDLDWEIVGLAVVVIIIGLAFRLLTAYAVVQCTDLNVRERLFVMICWIPKATVQAALGSMALDRANTTHSSPEEVRRGEIILVSAIFAILLTAPLGATAIAASGKRLLTKAQHHEHTPEVEEKDFMGGIDNLAFLRDIDRSSYRSYSRQNSIGDSLTGGSPQTPRARFEDSNTDTGIDTSSSGGSSGAEAKPGKIFYIHSNSIVESQDGDPKNIEFRQTRNPPSKEDSVVLDMEGNAATHL